MSFRNLIACVLLLTACSSAEYPVYKDASADVEDRVDDLVARMNIDEKIMQLCQYALVENIVENNFGGVLDENPAETGSFIYIGNDAVLRNAMQRKAMEESRLGIPVLFGHDVIHGYRTIFPVPLAQACSWNPELTRLGCEVAAKEAYSCGIDWTFSPMVDVARDPRWGRVMEGYGEDPYTTSVFCESAIRGYQGDDMSQENRIAACLKHYAGYAACEAGRDYVYAEISEQTLWTTYLPPFETGVKAGAATLMSAFHNISGTPASGSHYLLTEVLKERWGHDGFVVSDWDAVVQLVNQGMAADDKEAVDIAFNAGIEMDMADNLYSKHLKELLDEGRISMKQIDEAVSRVLRVKFRLGLFDRPYVEERPESERYLLPESLEIALQAAVESMVLLKNEGDLLPLEDVRNIAIVGPFATDKEVHLGNWSSCGRADDVTDTYQGIKKEFAGKADVVAVKGCDADGDDKSGFQEAVRAARSADVVIACLGHKRDWSGENQSRSTIEVPQIQLDLLKAVKASGKPVVVLTSSGRPIDMRVIDENSDAILHVWHPGTCAGTAIAGLLSGKYNPSGKLAMTFPYSSGQIPVYYNRRNSARRGTQGLYKDITSEPMYPFGYGLSYSEFEYGQMTVSSDEVQKDGKIYAEVSVKNVSDRDGMETVHWYICDPYSRITRPVKELKFFEKRLIKAGESEVFRFEIDPMRDFGYVNGKGDKYLDSGEYNIIVGDQSVTVNVN